MNEDIVKQCADRILEHWDNVVILVSKYDSESDKTDSFQHSRGNKLALAGHISEYQTYFEEHARERQREYMKDRDE